MENYFLPALLLTIVLETGLLFFILKVFFKDPIPLLRVLFSGLFASFATLPYLWFVLPLWMNSRYYLWVGEGGAIVVEGLFFKYFLALDWRKALVISALCNLFSYFAGIRWIAFFGL